MADLRLAISVDSSGAVTAIKTFNSEVEKSPAAASKASAAVGGLQKVFSDFTSSIAGGLGIGAGFAVGQKAADALFASFGVLTGGVRALTDQFEKGMGLLLGYSDQIVTLNQRTGLTTSVLQVLGAMAKTGGTGLEFLSGAVVKMELAINKGSEAFKKLGLDIVQMKALSPDAAFEKVATAVSGIVDPMQRAAAAVAIFGKAGAEMLPVLTAKMAEAREQAEAFGIVMQDKTLRASEALGDQLDLTKMAFDAFLMRVAGVVAESPALAAILDQLGLGFGRLSKAIEDNAPALTKWVDIGILGAVKAIETLLAALQKGMRMLEMFGGIAGTVFGFGAELTGLNQMIQKMKEFTQETQKAVLERASLAAWAAKNKGALNLPKAGGGPTFDGGGGKVEIKVAELKVPDLPNLWMNLFGGGAQGKFGTLQGGSKNYNLWGDKSKFLPPELDGNTHVGSDGNMAITKSSMSASQALQNLANIAALSGSKLGKALGGVFGGASGIAGALGGLGKATGALGSIGSILGKAGMWGQVASGVLSIGSSIFGLFKKKPKEPPPEPPKQASAKAWSDFTGEQQSKGASGLLAGVSGILPTSPEAMADQASIALGAYWAMWKTKGPMAAAEAFAPIRDKMMETFKAAGASDTDIAAMLGGMSSQIDLAQNKAFGGAAEGMNGYAQALASIANQQMPMTIDQFRAFERQAVAGYEQMKQAALDQGMSAEDAMKNALMSSGQFLTTLKDAAAKYGFDLGGSQALFDDASKAGVAFGASSEDRLIMSLDALTETLGGAPPKFQQAIAAGAAGAGSGGGLRGERSGDGTGIQESAEKTGDATAAALAPNLAEQTAALIAGFADALKNLPTPAIVLGDGAIAGAVIRDINAGNGGVATALDGRG